MKNYYLFFVISFLSISKVFSQNPTPNAGFENWIQTGNHFDPVDWNTLNPATAVVGVLTATRATAADVHSGSYAIKLTTKSVFNLTANGIASTGTIITTPPYGVIGGIPFTGRPDSIAGWFKCGPQPGDTGFAQILLMDANGDTVGFARWWAPAVAVNNYTRFSKAIDYYNTSTPATSQWILSSSKGFNQVVNSYIIFDDISLITNPVGLPEVVKKDEISVFPAVSSGSFNVKNTSGKKIVLIVFDNLGHFILRKEITESAHLINLMNYGKGMYFYEVYNENNLPVITGKIVNN